jgi:sugar lactone lactonase YvrE
MVVLLAGVLAMAVVLAGCGGDAEEGSTSSAHTPSPLAVAATFDTTQITGVAVSGSGRPFVNSPYWTDTHGASVFEVMGETAATPYPNAEWNRQWTEDAGMDPARTFVCVQSVYVDPENPETLWILDPASPKFEGVVPGGAKLVEVDLRTDTIQRTIVFDSTVAPRRSYLNDVRVSSDQRHAYITDSNLGALVVVDLTDGSARRVLDDHLSTAADTSYALRIGNGELRTADGSVPQIASDGIALSPDGQYVYYHALTGTHLYRLPTAALNDPDRSADRLAAEVEDLGETAVTDGMIAGPDGTIYHTALEADAVIGWHSERGLDTLVIDSRLQWPDSFALGPDGDLYVTTSQIHLMPQYNDGVSQRTDPYRVFRYPLSSPTAAE